MDFNKLDQYNQFIQSAGLFVGDRLRELRNYYKISLTYNSLAIEGNSLTESETERFISEDGLSLKGKSVKDMFETVGHAKAVAYIFLLIDSDEIKLSDIEIMHNLIYQNIEPLEPEGYRNQEIPDAKYPVTPPEKIEEELGLLDKWIVEERETFHPVQFAAELHRRFSAISPFKFGNNIIARLLMNTALLQAGYLPAVILPEQQHKYLSLLEKAQTDNKLFMEFIGERVLESQKEIARLFKVAVY